MDKRPPILFLVAITCYAASLNGTFVFDDTEAIVNNPDVITDSSLMQVFQNDFWGTKLSRKSSHKSYRPLAVLVFRLIRTLGGSTLKPGLFRLTNVLVHATIVPLLYYTLLEVLSSYRTDHSFRSDRDHRVAFLASLLFAVHPIHTENVCAAVGLADLLSTLFAILSFRLFIGTTKQYFQDSVIKLLGVVTLAGIAMLFKEQGITVLGTCCAYECIYWFNFERTNSHKEMGKQRIFKALFMTLGCSVLLWMRLSLMSFEKPVFHEEDNPISFLASRSMRMINFSYIYTLNVWLLIHPLWLCFDWSMGCVALIDSLDDARLIFVSSLWLMAGFLAYASVRSKNTRLRSLVQFSIAFAVISFLPASNVFLQVGFVIAERALYLPSISFMLIVVLGYEKIRSKLITTKIQHDILFVALLVLLYARSVQRSLDWENEMSLFESGLQVCPNNAKVHYNIAKIASDSGDRITAITEYRMAIQLNPSYYHAMNNLANLLKDSNNLDEAEMLLMNAIEIKADFYTAHMNLGIVQTSLKKFNDAENSYKTALKLRRNYGDCLFNLGNLYLELERFDEALAAWLNATKIKPQLIAAWNNLIVMLDNRSQFEKALEVAAEAVRHHPNDSSLHFNYGNVLGKIKRFEEAERMFKHAVAISEEAVYYANLGVLYHRWMRFDDAKRAYLRALELNPSLDSAKENLKTLRRKT